MRRPLLPRAAYGDRAFFDACAARVFPRCWTYLAAAGDIDPEHRCHPVALLPELLDEPLVLTRVGGALRCLSNVCPHRGNVVVTAPSRRRTLTCGYHGRTFDLDGRCTAAPGFEAVPGFPEDVDHLPEASLRRLGPMLFAGLEPAMPWVDWMGPVLARTAHLDPQSLVRDPQFDRDFEVDAAWPLYVENYLEGLHIPFVHRSLDAVVERDDYRVVPLRWAVLQIGVARDGQPAIEPPPGHPEHGTRVAAWYFWLFPGTMVNVYPWGISLNAVEPLGPKRTRVKFRRWVRPGAVADGAGADLDRVEAEDEAVVEQVQRGVRSRLFGGGHLLPGAEDGLLRFHELLSAMVG
jgi:choline monooxygenase